MHSDKLEVSHWIKICKVIFKQIVECIEYIHSRNVCHFDISLSKFVINDAWINYQQNENIKQKAVQVPIEDIQVKLCDFGIIL